MMKAAKRSVFMNISPFGITTAVICPLTNRVWCETSHRQRKIRTLRGGANADIAGTFAQRSKPELCRLSRSTCAESPERDLRRMGTASAGNNRAETMTLRSLQPAVCPRRPPARVRKIRFGQTRRRDAASSLGLRRSLLQEAECRHNNIDGTNSDQ